MAEKVPISLCGECSGAAVYGDYLCAICRMVTDEENSSVLPKGYYDQRCEYCGTRHVSVIQGRFLGLCYECKALAKRSVPPLDDESEELLWEKFDDTIGHHGPSYDEGYSNGFSEGLDEGLAQGRREEQAKRKERPA